MQPISTRRAWILPLLVGLCTATFARAEELPPTEERLAWAGSLADVEVEVPAPELADCPTAEAMATQTNAYAGRTFAHTGGADPATARVRLVFARGPKGSQVDVRLLQPDDTAPGGASLRVHDGVDSCEELGKMAALTVSLLARTTPEAAPPAAAVAVAAPAAAPAAEPSPPPEPSAPPPPPVIEPTPEPAAPAKAAAPERTPHRTGFELGASLLGGYGHVPGWSGGGGLFGAYRAEHFAVRLAASFQAGPGETVPATGARYSGFGGTGDVSGCYAPWPRSEACLVGGLLWLVGSGSDFEQDRQGLGASPFLGLGLAQRFAAGSHWEWGLRLEGTVPLAPIELLFEDSAGSQTKLWQMPPVGVRLGVELAFY